MKTLLKSSIVFFFICTFSFVKAQNTAITDDNAYTPDSSAILDVKSIDKGMLVPRLTSLQRIAVSNPATGLLVFDTDENNFYFYNGTSWVNLTSANASGILSYTPSNKVYLTDVNNNLGVGSVAPNSKLEVKSDIGDGIDDPIFAVINNTGDTVFAVFPQGVRINVYDDPNLKAKSKKGGFAVGGFSPAKGTTDEFLRVTSDSIRLYVKENVAKAPSRKGGFAVGGFSPAKGVIKDYLKVTNDSTRIYTTDPVAGFGVEDGTGSGYMKLTPENYFIGHQAGDQVTTGISNLFLGYKSGLLNQGGNNNIYMGHFSGSSAVDCSHNVFVGSEAGKYTNNTIGSGAFGSYNVLVGRSAGYTNTDGYSNAFLGDQSGYFNTTGYYNTFLGAESGLSNTTGIQNIYIGYRSGPNANALASPPFGLGNGNDNICFGNNSGVSITSGNSNIFFGISSGFSNTSGVQNIFLGSYSGYSNTDGQQNIFVGSNTGSANTLGNYNLFIGVSCGTRNTTASDNLFLGGFTGYNNTEGSSNVFIGRNSGYSNEIGNENVFLGLSSGLKNISGSNNTFIGNRSGYNNLVGDGNVFIGYRAGENETQSNKLYIDNSTTSTPLIYGDFIDDKVTINNVLILTPIASAPTNPVNGEIYINSVDNHIYCYLGGVWKQLD